MFFLNLNSFEILDPPLEYFHSNSFKVIDTQNIEGLIEDLYNIGIYRGRKYKSNDQLINSI